MKLKLEIETDLEYIYIDKDKIWFQFDAGKLGKPYESFHLDTELKSIHEKLIKWYLENRGKEIK